MNMEIASFRVYFFSNGEVAEYEEVENLMFAEGEKEFLEDGYVNEDDVHVMFKKDAVGFEFAGSIQTRPKYWTEGTRPYGISEFYEEMGAEAFEGNLEYLSEIACSIKKDLETEKVEYDDGIFGQRVRCVEKAITGIEWMEIQTVWKLHVEHYYCNWSGASDCDVFAELLGELNPNITHIEAKAC
jgi:hypothetical protein